MEAETHDPGCLANELLHSDAVAMQGVYFDGFHWKRKRAHFLNIVLVVPWDGHLTSGVYFV